jgi:hypothetical protein
LLDPVLAKGMPTQSSCERSASVTWVFTAAKKGFES